VRLEIAVTFPDITQ